MSVRHLACDGLVALVRFTRSLWTPSKNLSGKSEILGSIKDLSRIESGEFLNAPYRLDDRLTSTTLSKLFFFSEVRGSTLSMILILSWLSSVVIGFRYGRIRDIWSDVLMGITRLLSLRVFRTLRRLILQHLSALLSLLPLLQLLSCTSYDEGEDPRDRLDDFSCTLETSFVALSHDLSNDRLRSFSRFVEDRGWSPSYV